MSTIPFKFNLLFSPQKSEAVLRNTYIPFKNDDFNHFEIPIKLSYTNQKLGTDHKLIMVFLRQWKNYFKIFKINERFHSITKQVENLNTSLFLCVHPSFHLLINKYLDGNSIGCDIVKLKLKFGKITYN